jgi:hypothetical protein
LRRRASRGGDRRLKRECDFGLSGGRTDGRTGRPFAKMVKRGRESGPYRPGLRRQPPVSEQSSHFESA